MLGKGPGLCWGGWEREDSQNASALSAGERRLAARWAALADPPRRLFARLFRRAAAASGGVTREAAAAYPEIDVPAAAAALVGSGLAARPGWRGAAAVVPALRLAELRDAARRAAPDGPALAALGRAALVDRLLAALPPPSPGGGITVQPLPPPPPVAPPVTPDRGGGGGGGTGSATAPGGPALPPSSLPPPAPSAGGPPSSGRRRRARSSSTSAGADGRPTPLPSGRLVQATLDGSSAAERLGRSLLRSVGPAIRQSPGAVAAYRQLGTLFSLGSGGGGDAEASAAMLAEADMLSFPAVSVRPETPLFPDRDCLLLYSWAAALGADVDAVVTGREWAAAVALGGVAEAELWRFWRPAGWGEGWEEEGGDDGDDNEDNNDNHMDDADDSDVDATFMGFVGRGLDVDGDKFKEEPPSTSLHATRR